ncbi:681_t:CDS:2 [Dentiscutata heterogama]|uniref:681_t:CDS:1 n=1 Tax=Dentiscutata heterogama TaxID=1316150 RepID=A0ACA9LJE3_9GLOM|nr:681_t:CDS:2 [Dentiscutata heterogama]
MSVKWDVEKANRLSEKWIRGSGLSRKGVVGAVGYQGKMEVHLANICLDVLKDIKEYWQELLSNKIINYKRTKSPNQKQYDLAKTILRAFFIFN